MGIFNFTHCNTHVFTIVQTPTFLFKKKFLSGGYPRSMKSCENVIIHLSSTRLKQN